MLVARLNEKNITELLKFEDPSTQGERSDAVVDTAVDLGKLNPKFEVLFCFDHHASLLSLTDYNSPSDK